MWRMLSFEAINLDLLDGRSHGPLMSEQRRAILFAADDRCMHAQACERVALLDVDRLSLFSTL